MPLDADPGSEPDGAAAAAGDHGPGDDDGPLPPVDAPSPGELLIGLLDGTISRFARRPVKARAKLTRAGALRGRADVLVFELGGLSITGLLVDRLVVHLEDVRIEPGFPPRLRSGPVGFKATVRQHAVDRWTKASRLPVRLQLTPEGIVARTHVRSIALSEVAMELDVVGAFIKLRPKRASMLGVPAPLVGLLRGYLPLPPLPLGAHLTRVEAGDGELTTWFSLPEIDEPLSPELAFRLRRRLARLPLPIF